MPNLLVEHGQFKGCACSNPVLNVCMEQELSMLNAVVLAVECRVGEVHLYVNEPRVRGSPTGR